jgi:anti-sigma regulatory factor (Ser/Thr protein kinase)
MTRRMAFAKSPRSVSAARSFARSALPGLPPEALEVVELMVSELATNCIRHSKTAFDVSIDQRADEVRIEVSDQAGGQPIVRSPGPEDPRGRGLKIVEMLSEAWGVDYHPGDGKTVWFSVSAAAQTAA